jgi:hypothetical protein
MDANVSQNPADQGLIRRINPFLVPPDQQGWRGLSIPGNRKRKAYTVLHNEQVLVTALLQIPGETGCRHSHETGELTITYGGELRPVVLWHPPGVLHSGLPEQDPAHQLGAIDDLAALVRALSGGNQSGGALELLATTVATLQAQVTALKEQLEQATKPAPGPRVIIDVLFPPFKTTIDDPAYAEKRTVVGQWFD